MMFSVVSLLFLQGERSYFTSLIEQGVYEQEQLTKKYRPVSTVKELILGREYVGPVNSLKSLSAAIEAETTQGIEIPLFPGCENIKLFPLRARCSFQKLGKFFDKHFEMDRVKDRKGQVQLTFTVPLSGKVTHARLEEDTNAHLAAELMRVFGVMQGKGIRWNPGKQNGKKVAMDMKFKFNINQECTSCEEQLEVAFVEASY